MARHQPTRFCKLEQPTLPTMADERILIVENEREVAELIQQCLQQQGYSVVGIAENGEQGLQQAVELRPDLALMDIHLGSGLDGVQIAERLQADLSIPVIFLTG